MEQAVLQATRNLVRRSRQPSMTEIAEAAGTSRATLYRLFGSREELLRQAGLEPDRAAEEKILEAARTLAAERGLHGFSFEELASAAGLSRATVYRLYPGRSALLRGLLLRYSPLEPVTTAVERLQGRPPAEVMPELARLAAQAADRNRGLLVSVLSDLARLDPDVLDNARFALGRIAETVLPYVLGQMQAGRLRAGNPVLLLQGFVGPLFMHVMTRPLLERAGLPLPPLEEAATQLADGWVRAYGKEVSE